MWKTALIVCIFFSGCLAESERMCSFERFEKCEKLAPVIDPENPSHLFPNAERLEVVCPAIHAVFDCILEDTRACFDEDMEEWLNSDNETLASISNVLLGTKGLMEDLCDTTSQFHKVYIQNIDCIKDASMAPMAIPICALEAKGLYGAYRYGEEGNDRENYCMTAAHMFACISGDIFVWCGEEARATFVELLKRTQLLKHGICTPQHVQELKTKYIDFLELKSERRSIFEKVFDMRKRK